MKRTTNFALVAAVAAAVLLFGGLRGAGDADESALSSFPAGDASFAAGDGSTAAIVERLEQLIDSGAERRDAHTRLGFAYLGRAGATADPAFYPLAEAAFKRALVRGESEYLATTGLAALAASRHRFALAADLARRAIELSPTSAAPYGILGDALLERGRYDEAFAAFEQMVTLKPSGSSYARISYALELQGDLGGAVEAMRLASDASPAVGPTAAWVRTLIGNLYVAEGRLELAARSYRDALGRSAAYAPALAGLAAVETRRGRLPHAAELYGRALEIAPVPDHAVALGDVLARMNREAEAEAAYASAQRLESRFARFGGRNELETALFDLDQDRELRSALARARVGAQLRPSVEGEHVLAWALYKNGRCQDARARSIRALRLGTLDVGAMYHRVLIERCLGNEIAAESFLARVRALDPSFLDAPPSSFRLGDATDG